MDKTLKLKSIILKKYNSIREFAKAVEIPATTLNSSLERGIGGMGVDKVIKICDILDIDIKTFEPNQSIGNTIFSSNEESYIEELRKLNDDGIDKAISYTKDLTEVPKYQRTTNIVEVPKKEIWEEEGKEYLMPIAAHDDNLTESEKEYMNSVIENHLKNM